MDKLFNGVYRGKKILITGHTGFKGSWLSLWLIKMGAEVIGYSADIPTNPSHFELLDLKMTSITADILDKAALLDTIEKYNPDIVFHMAAQPQVRKSYIEPALTLETNIMGTVNILETCRQSKKVKAIVNITSDKCYENRERVGGYREEDAMGGNDPYSASKGAAELVANSYRKSFFNPNEYGKSHSTLLADARAGNVIGGGDWAKDRLIPDMIKAASKNESMVIRNPHATRPWQHVLEPLSGYLHLGWRLLEEKKEFADNWNFGPQDDSSLPVEEAVERSKKYWDKISYRIVEDPNNFHEANLLGLDSSKARTKLRWRGVWDSEKAFEKTIHWYREYYLNKRILSEKDLGEYIEGAKRISIEWAI